MEPTLTETLTLTLSHRKYTDDCPLMPSDVTGVKWLKKHNNVYDWSGIAHYYNGIPNNTVDPINTR